MKFFTKIANQGFCLITALLLFSPLATYGQTGTIKGTLRDASNQNPLIGANIMLAGTNMGAASDSEGQFVIPRVPVGQYTLKFSYIGYSQQAMTDVVVRSQRITFVEVALQPSALASEEVVITAGYFPQNDEQPTSLTSFSQEEIRRAPGSAGDISRILMSLPSIAKINDQSNSLIVRGGSPLENAFFVDNIEIPNINHFPAQGSSGGPIGVLNVDLIRDVDFYAGGFGAHFGDRLSSAMDIRLREGNRDEFDGQLDFNFAGLGGVFEGPLPKQRGAWLLSLRRSYLDLLVDAIDVGTSIAPVYSDAQAKVTYDLGKRHKLTALLVRSDDYNDPDQDTARENDMLYYGNQDIVEQTIGVNWRALWGGNAYGNTSIAHTATRFKEDFYETGSGALLVKNRSHEQAVQLRHLSHVQLRPEVALELGFETKFLRADYDNFYPPYSDAFGDTVQALALQHDPHATKMATFATLQIRPVSALSLTFGGRLDYFSFNKNASFSPRLAVTYQISNRTTLHGAVGLFRQNLPLLLLAQNDANKALRDPLASHMVLGFSHLLTENTRLSLEAYQKNYRHFPIDPAQPALFVLDELFYRYGFFFSHERLVDAGKASARGVELIVQKKLANKVYGLASAAWFRSKYTGLDGMARDRVFDNRFIFSVEGGYKPNQAWEFSLRWIYAGGPPYTPFDMAASQALNRAVLDQNRINTVRYPAYHSLNVRFDRRFHFRSSNLVFYFSVWNAYNRKNVASYFWNQVKNEPDVLRQWGMLPIFGLEFEW